MRRVLRISAIVLLSLVLVLVIGVLVLLRTDFARVKLRDIMQARIAAMIDGEIRIGGVSGGLLGDITITDVVIDDDSGTRFVSFDTLSARYDLLWLLRGRYAFSDVRLVGASVFLDRKTDAEWNYARIFRLGRDSTGADTTTRILVLRFDRVQIVDGDLALRIPWQPDPALRGADRQTAITAALSDDFLFRVERAGDTYQMHQDYNDIDAVLPTVRLLDREDATMLFDIDTLAAIASVLRRDRQVVANANAVVSIGEDSLQVRDLHLQLPASAISGDGSLELETGAISAAIHADSLSGSDIYRLDRRIPEGLRSTFNAVIALGRQRSRYHLSDLVAQVGSASAAGQLELGITPAGLSQTEFDTDLRVTSVGTGLLERLVPGMQLPARGTFTGTFAGSGTLMDAQVRGDLVFNDSLSGPSHFIAAGGVTLADTMRLRDFELQLQPARIEILRNSVPDFPLEGELRGRATLNGAVADSIASVLDLELRSEGRVTHVTGAVDYWTRDDNVGSVSLDLRTDQVDIALLNAFLPDSAPRLHGTADGSLRANGPMTGMQVGLDLAIERGGTVTADGNIGLVADTLSYDLNVSTERFNAAAILDSVHVSSINSVFALRGRGVDLGRANTTIDLAVRPSTYREFELDSARTTLQLRGGLLRVDTLGAWLSGAVAHAAGALGVTDSTSSTLAFRIGVDSLGTLARWIPRDTTTIVPRPARITEAYRAARADSARIARATELQRAITGEPPPRLNVNLPPAIPADSIAGRALVAGTITGNLDRMDALAALTASDVVASGMTAQKIDGSVSLVILPPDSLGGRVDLRLTAATVAGYSIDSISTRGSWSGNSGSIDLAVMQGAERRFRVVSDIARQDGATLIDLQSAVLRFDSLTTWQTPHPARITLRRDVVSVDSLALDAGNGSIRVSGRLSSNMEDSISLRVYNAELAHIMSASQSDIDMTGLLTGAASISGGLDAPTFSGAAGFVNGTLSGNPLPELHATFDYDGTLMKTGIIATRDMGEPFATGTATFGLALGRGRTRMLNAPVNAQFHMDGLPLELVPDLTENVSRISGNLVGELSVTGTTDNPDVRGNLTVTSGQAYINYVGVQLDSIDAQLNIDADSVVIERFTARSGGPVRLTGGLGLARLSEPSFDLHLTATNAYVLNNDRGRLRAADVDVYMDGEYTAASIRGWVRLRNGVVYLPDYSDKVVVAPWDSLFLYVLDTADVRARELYVTPNPFLDNLDVQIQLEVPRDTWVRSPDANIELFTEGPLRINLAQPSRTLSLEGVLSTDRGQYTFLSRRFEIKRGTATFFANQTEINPTVQITGDHEVNLPGSSTVTISVMIGGTMLQPRVRLESDAQPPLSQSDMLAYLAAGRSTTSILQLGASGLAPVLDFTGVGKIAGQSFIGLALGTLVSEVEREAEGAGMRQLGLDLLNISPAETYTEIAKGDIWSFLRQTEVEAGRYVNTRTFVAGQMRLSATPGVRAVHRTPKGFRFEASWEPRLLLREPTLAEQRSLTKRAFALFIIREWRF